MKNTTETAQDLEGLQEELDNVDNQLSSAFGLTDDQKVELVEKAERLTKKMNELKDDTVISDVNSFVQSPSSPLDLGNEFDQLANGLREFIPSPSSNTDKVPEAVTPNIMADQSTTQATSTANVTSNPQPTAPAPKETLINITLGGASIDKDVMLSIIEKVQHAIFVKGENLEDLTIVMTDPNTKTDHKYKITAASLEKLASCKVEGGRLTKDGKELDLVTSGIIKLAPMDLKIPMSEDIMVNDNGEYYNTRNKKSPPLENIKFTEAMAGIEDKLLQPFQTRNGEKIPQEDLNKAEPFHKALRTDPIKVEGFKTIYEKNNIELENKAKEASISKTEPVKPDMEPKSAKPSFLDTLLKVVKDVVQAVTKAAHSVAGAISKQTEGKAKDNKEQALAPNESKFNKSQETKAVQFSEVAHKEERSKHSYEHKALGNHTKNIIEKEQQPALKEGNQH